MDDALRAGLTSSPDFFRIKQGFVGKSLSSSSLSDALRAGESSLLHGKSKKALVSVLDLECKILRAPADNGRPGESWGCDPLTLLEVSIRGAGSPSVILACFVSSLACLYGEPARCCSIIPMAACSSASFPTSLTLPRLIVASSSLDV